jgi:hypothetical protein
MTYAVLQRPATSTVEPPERSLTQRMHALAKGNRIRTHRAQLKRDLKARREHVSLILLGFEERPDRELLESMKVLDLLLAAPKLGRVKVNRTLVQARVSPSKTLAGLSDRQRAELIALTRGR